MTHRGIAVAAAGLIVASACAILSAQGAPDLVLSNGTISSSVSRYNPAR